MSNFKYFTIIACLGLCLSCQDDSKKKETSTTSFYTINLKTDTISIDKLSPKALNFTNDWSAYLAIKSEIERIQNSNIGDALNNAENIIRISDSLKTSLPEKFNVPAINSRLKLIETQAKAQQQFFIRKSQDTAAIKESIYKLIQGFSSLNIQINELFIEQPEFIEPEN